MVQQKLYSLIILLVYLVVDSVPSVSYVPQLAMLIGFKEELLKLESSNNSLVKFSNK
jgi:hypothetical protein